MRNIVKKELFTDFLIKYAEIGIKGRDRFMFEDALVGRIKSALENVDGSFRVYKTPGRIFVSAESEFDFDEAVDALSHVFGIVGICPVVKIEKDTPESLYEAVVSYMKEMYGEKLCAKGETGDRSVKILQDLTGKKQVTPRTPPCSDPFQLKIEGKTGE